MTLQVRDILGPQGRISQRLPHYEQRPEQLEMAAAVARAIDAREHLVVEAGTGVGKSFAYLIPAILAATRERQPDEPRLRVVVATHTISLQEQLIERDIPFLNAVLPLEFSAVLVKGRSNYISLRRMNGAVQKAHSLYSDPAEIDQLDRIAAWSKSTTDGSRSDLSFQPLLQVWDEVQSEHGNCLGRKCPTYEGCYYYAARRRVWNADILVVNHALFFSDLALRREGASVLPDYQVVVFDEAHTVEAVAADHLGITVSSGQIDYLLNRLYNDRTNKGLLVTHRLNAAQQMAAEIRLRSGDFFYAIREWQELHGASNGRVRKLLPLDNQLSPVLQELAGSIAEYAAKIEKEEDKIELTAAVERCHGLAGSLETWLKQRQSDAVYWIEKTGRNQQHTRLVCAPIEIGPILRAELFDQVNTVVLTSATLAVGRQDFGFIKGRLGLTHSIDVKLGSPFNYRQQVKLVLPARMPDPTANAREYEQAVCDRIKQYTAQTGGRAFVLFTSYRMLKNCAAQLSGWFSQQRMSLYCQGDGLPRSLLLERFRQNERAVLFGADSFWQGVDVPGDALQNVIITKLPFSVPDEPLLEARLEAIRSRGGNPFVEYQVPEAVIKLKQGFGRLIRRATDTGQVVILDPRVRTKPYGRTFLESLPECQTIVDP